MCGGLRERKGGRENKRSQERGPIKVTINILKLYNKHHRQWPRKKGVSGVTDTS